MTRLSLRRWAQGLLAVGLLVLACCAVAFAQDPAPTPTPTPETTPTATATPTPTPTAMPIATLVATPVATETATATATTTATATVTPTATPTASATPGAPVALTSRPQPSGRPRAVATPPPDPTPTPPDQFTGASLTLCHYTGDASHPYEAVTITADQFSGYFDEEQDIIPAPQEGCDNITDPEAAANEKVTVCHLNHDGTYTLFTYAPGDLGGHEPDKGDLIPAPRGMCPGADGQYVVAATPTPARTATPTATAAHTATPTATPTADSGVDPASAGSTPSDGTPAAAVNGATSPSELPFTGLDLWLIACAGLALTLMGAGLRLIAAAQPA
jgi:hypothetical protein